MNKLIIKLAGYYFFAKYFLALLPGRLRILYFESWNAVLTARLMALTQKLENNPAAMEKQILENRRRNNGNKHDDAGF